MYYDAPGLTLAGAQALNDQADAPLATTSRPWLGGSGAVGGIAELPAVEPDAAAAESRFSGPGPLALGGLAAAGPLLLVTGAWHARRRWLK